MNRVPVFGGRMNKIVIAGIAAALLGILACATEPEARTVEVTREVPVVQEVPVTVQTIQTLAACPRNNVLYELYRLR